MRQVHVEQYGGTGATLTLPLGFNPVYCEFIDRAGGLIATWWKNKDAGALAVHDKGLDGLDTDPAPGIGSTPANVANQPFRFTIAGIPYTKAATAAGTAPGNDVIPANLYGACAFDIVSAGTITAVEASANATGYATADLAIAGIPAVTATNIRAFMVTVMRPGATFTFGTTSLATAGITVAYYTGGAGVTGVIGRRLAGGVVPYGDAVGDTYTGIEISNNEIINKLGATYILKAYRS
jgi:hypothetical protein